MRRRRITCLVAGLVSGPLVTLAPATPAHAAEAAVAFVGTANVNPGLSAPVVGPPGNGVWAVVVNGPGAVSVPGGAGVVFAAQLQAAGDLHGGAIVQPFGPGALCGLSGGSDGVGAANLAPVGPSGVPLTNVGWVQSAATIIVFSGRAGATGNLAGVASAIPPVAGVAGVGSCLAGTAVQFTLVGAAALTF